MSEGRRAPAYSRPVRQRFDEPWLADVEDVLARAAGRSGEEARAVRESATGTPNGAFLARSGDLARAQWFLWVWAALAAGERLGRPLSAEMHGSSLSPLLLAYQRVPRLEVGG